MPRLYVQAQKFQIAGSGVSSSATSVNLVSFKIIKPDGSTRDIAMTDFGDLGLMVLDPGVSRKEETISFTGVTQNGDGSATLTGVTRGITPFSPYGADSSYASAHSGFVTAILSNPAKMYSNFIGPSDNVTVTGLWNFPYPTSATSPATKQYVDDVLAGTIGTATDTNAGSTRMTKNQSSKPRAKSTYVREQDTPDMTLKVESFKLAFIDSLTTFAGGNSPAFINPGFAGDLAIVSNPSNTETVTLTINGTVCTFTFVTSIGATPGNILIQGTAALTRAALATFIANPGTTNANQVAFTGAQLTAMGLVSSTDDLSANLFIRANSATVTTFTGAETMAGGSNTWTANTTKNRLDLLVLNGGSLAIRKGSEAVTPVAPTPTTGDTVLCSVYNIPGETAIRDKTAALSGYIDEWYDLSIYRTDVLTSSSINRNDLFGNGLDGDATIASGTTTLTRDMFYNNLTLQTGAVLQTGGYQIFVKGTLTQQGTGVIRNNGGDGGATTTTAAGAAGTAPSGVTVPIGKAGSAGGTGGGGGAQNGGAGGAGGAGVAGAAAANSVGSNGAQGSGSGAGGAGGVGGGGAGSNGAAGTATSSVSRVVDSVAARILGVFSTGTYTIFSANAGNGTAGGGGGGGGGGTGSTGGAGGGSGGGGGNGGWIVIFAKTIVVNSGVTLFQAKGGAGGNGANGANGVNVSGGGGGGGGGGAGGIGGNGGCVIVVYSSKSATITYDVTGGANGTGGTGGTAAGGGTAGSNATTAGTPIAGQTIEIAA